MSLQDLCRLIDRHVVRSGAQTPIPRQHLVREPAAAQCRDLPYEPMVCFVASGAKTVEVGGGQCVAAAGMAFVGLLDAPALASFTPVYRSATLRIDEQVVASVLADLGSASTAEPGAAFAVHAMDDGLRAAVIRWVGLLDEPRHIAALAPAAEVELIYRLLTGPHGGLVRSMMTSEPTTQIRNVTKFLMVHYARGVSISELAAVAGMSPATLHRRFKSYTGLTPVQFQRQARLAQARRLLARPQHTAASAAAAVGYRSPSQFSRDYRQRYGLPPRQDALRLRAPESS